MKARIKNQVGDTIVEVLIAIAIMSFIVGLGYAMSNSSSKSLRSSQERSEAVKLAEGQVEQLRIQEGIDPNMDCFDSDAVGSEATDNNKCAYSTNGGSGCVPATAGYCYNVKIEILDEETGDPTDERIIITYKVTVEWDSATGSDDKVDIVYKIATINPDYVASQNPPPSPFGEPVIGGNNNEPNPCLTRPGGCQPRPGIYRYNRTFRYLALNGIDQANVTSCTWDFGDGSPPQSGTATSNICRVGARVPHTFPEDPRYPAGSPCMTGNNFQKRSYTIRLTVYRNNGPPVSSNVETTSVPYCT